jgi:drug/metabolite transporter superfamily protein YnfA
MGYIDRRNRVQQKYGRIEYAAKVGKYVDRNMVWGILADHKRATSATDIEGTIPTTSQDVGIASSIVLLSLYN